MSNSPLNLIRTSEEQMEAVDLLEEMIAENFKKNPSPKKANTSFFSKNFYANLLATVDGSNREENEKFLNKIISDVKNLKKIKITLAYPLDASTLKRLEDWLNTNNLQEYIFDINYDPTILGGAIIVGQKGEYKDFSLSKRVDEYLNNVNI